MPAVRAAVRDLADAGGGDEACVGVVRCRRGGKYSWERFRGAVEDGTDGSLLRKREGIWLGVVRSAAFQVQLCR